MSTLGDKAAEKYLAAHTGNPVVFRNESVTVYAAFANHRMGYLLTDPHNWA